MFQVDVSRNPERARRLAWNLAVSIFQVPRADDSLFPGFQRLRRLCNPVVANGQITLFLASAIEGR